MRSLIKGLFGCFLLFECLRVERRKFKFFKSNGKFMLFIRKKYNLIKFSIYDFVLNILCR